MKTTSIRNCQACGKQFTDRQVVIFVPLDNNIVCYDCANGHDKWEQRVVEIEYTCNPVTTSYDVLKEILRHGVVTPTPSEEEFLRWFSIWDNETTATLGGLLKKCLKVGGKNE